MAEPATWHPLDPACWFALGCVAVIAATPLWRRRTQPTVLDRLPRFAVEVLLGWSGIGAAVLAVTAALPALLADAAWIATTRTALLVAATILTARLGRSVEWREAGWLTYPLLIITGAKLLVSDVPQGRPMTMFVALALYGTALIVAPRELRRTPPVPSPEPDAGPLRGDEPGGTAPVGPC